MPDESLTHLPHEAEILRSIQTHPELCAFLLAVDLGSSSNTILHRTLFLSEHSSDEARDRVMQTLYSMRFKREARLLLSRKPKPQETVAPIEWD